MGKGLGEIMGVEAVERRGINSVAGDECRNRRNGR